MGKIIDLENVRKKKLNNSKIDELELEMTGIIGEAEFIETEDGDIIMDAISEAKVDEIEKKIKLELLKRGYSMEEINAF